jgi:hypothetical protein
MNRSLSALAGLLALTCGMAATHAAFIVEADNVAPAGKASDHFTSVPAGTGFSLSTAVSQAAGLAGNQSAFGNPANGTGPDQYTFRYTPGTDADNTVFAAGAALGNSFATDPDGAGPTAPVYATVAQTATGIAGGASGIYNVYFTGPSSGNVNVAGSRFDITNDLAAVVLNPVNMNDTNTGPDEVAGAPFTGGLNNRWLKIASVQLTAGNTYTVTVTANVNPPDFVSQRAHGVMWEYVGPAIPEPTSLALAVLAVAGCTMRRR